MGSSMSNVSKTEGQCSLLQPPSGSNMDNAPGAPKPIPFHLLEEITNAFSEQRKLGGGAFGDVYLGEHKNGDKIAVKVLKDLDLDDKLFKKEYSNLANLDHKNIVRLIGYCHETRKEFIPYEGRMVFAEKIKRALCFECIQNGSLDKFISDESNSHNWRTRHAIIKGICEGVEYLHEKLESPMYHLDLKPANVLLDDRMTPKIADFGLSRLFGGDKTQMTNSAIGTPGYIPPEYIDAAVISIKFDIFSLGVVIIKIMTGPDGYFRSAEMSPQQFVELVHADWMNRLQATAVHVYSAQVRRCIEIALSCVEADRHKRPSIGVIVSSLNETEEFRFQILDALRNGSASSTDKLCPCITNDTEMLDILKNKFISYPLRITDNRGVVHKVRITTVADPAGDTSTSELVRPRIKIIDYSKEDLNEAAMMIDAHSTEPWILLGHLEGNVSIWNLQNQTRVSVFHLQGHTDQVCAVRFVEPLQCIMVGDREGYIHVHSYGEVDKKLQNFRAHVRPVVSLEVHPSEPFVLSAARDMLIKLWNWEAGWQCIRTFEGHSHFMSKVRFNPRFGADSFASVSWDSTIKIWNLHSPTPVATLDYGITDPFNTCLDYFITSCDRRYLVTGSGHGIARIWDLQTNTSIKQFSGLQRVGRYIAVVESLPGHPIQLTVSEDNSVAWCDSATHRFENRVNFNLGTVWAFAYVSTIKSLAILCHHGIAIMEID